MSKENLQRAASDAKAKGVVVKEVNISAKKHSGDFAAAVNSGVGRYACRRSFSGVVTGIDGLIYQSASQENLAAEGRTPFIRSVLF